MGMKNYFLVLFVFLLGPNMISSEKFECSDSNEYTTESLDYTAYITILDPEGNAFTDGNGQYSESITSMPEGSQNFFFGGSAPGEILKNEAAGDHCRKEGQYSIRYTLENHDVDNADLSCEMGTYTIDYDQYEEHCTECWLWNEQDSKYQFETNVMVWADDPLCGDNCCGDDNMLIPDDPDCAEEFCEACVLGERVKLNPPKEGVKELARIWDGSAPNGSGCCGDDSDEDPDLTRDFCLYCQSGENQPGGATDQNPVYKKSFSQLKDLASVRVWYSELNEIYNDSCCGDDRIDHNDKVYDSKYICLEEEVICSELNMGEAEVADNRTPYYGDSSEGEASGDFYYWVDPASASHKVITFQNDSYEENRSMENPSNEYELYSDGDDWHLCDYSSFGLDDYLFTNGAFSGFSKMNPGPYDSEDSEDLVCSVALINSGVIEDAENDFGKPTILECDDSADRDFCGVNLGGLDPSDGFDTNLVIPWTNDLGFFNLSINSFFQPVSFEKYEVPKLSSDIDSMAFIDESLQGVCSEGPCMMLTYDEYYYVFEGDKITKGEIANLFTSIGIDNIEALSYIPSSVFDDNKAMLLGYDGTEFFSYSDTTQSKGSLSELLTGEEGNFEIDPVEDGFTEAEIGLSSMLFLDRGELNFGFPVIVILTPYKGTEYYLAYEYTNSWEDYVAELGSAGIKGSVGSANASAYISPEHSWLSFPGLDGHSQRDNQALVWSSGRILYLALYPFLFCDESNGWQTDLDNYPNLCDSYLGDDSYFIGVGCCGNSLDGYESFSPLEEKFCYRGDVLKNQDNDFDDIYVRDKLHSNSDSQLGEVVWKKDMVAGCAVDHEAACQNTPGCDFAINDHNKPYQGTSNLLYNGDFENDDYDAFWDNNDFEIGEAMSSKGPGLRIADADSSLSQRLYRIQPSTTYNFRVWIENYEDAEKISFDISYEVSKGGQLEYEESKSHLVSDGGWHSLVFSTPAFEAGLYDFHKTEHKISISMSLNDKEVVVDKASLTSNDYLQDSLFKDSYSDDKAYCEGLDVWDDDNVIDVYCGYDERWHRIEGLSEQDELDDAIDNGDFGLKYIAWSDEALNDDLSPLISSGIQIAGCCVKDKCWNGTACVPTVTETGEMKIYPNSSLTDAGLPGYACVLDDDGNGVWKELMPKWTWDNQYINYCIEDSECLVDKSGNLSITEPHNYSLKAYESGSDNQNPYCIADSDYIGDHYCDNGNWTTRTSMVAEKLVQYPGLGDFSLMCTDAKYALNLGYGIPFENYSDNVPTVELYDGCNEDIAEASYDMSHYFTNDVSSNTACLIRDCTYHNTGSDSAQDIAMPCINSVCVLRNNEPGNEFTLVGFSHNRKEDHLDSKDSKMHFPIANLFGSDNANFCDDSGSAGYESCSGIYYEGEKQIVIFSEDKSISSPDGWSSGNSGIVDDIFTRFLEVFWDVYDEPPVYDKPAAVEFTTDKSDFYYSESSDGRKVYAAFSESYNRNDSKYSDFYADFQNLEGESFCSAVENLLGDYKYCKEGSVSEYQIVDQGLGSGNMFSGSEYRKFFTWMLRLRGG